MKEPTQYPISVAQARLNSWLPEGRRLSLDQIRDMAGRHEIAATRTEGGHLRFTDDAIMAVMLKLTGPQVSLEDFTTFAGACEKDEHLVLQFHKLGAELALQPSRAEQLRTERDSIIHDFETRSAAAYAEGRHDLAWSLRSRASALKATAYQVIGGVVRAYGAPGAIAPGMPSEFIPETAEDRVDG
jgi:hypothetical protein